MDKIFRVVALAVIIFIVVSLIYRIDLWTNQKAVATGYSFSDDISASTYLDLINSTAAWDSVDNQVVSRKGGSFWSITAASNFTDAINIDTVLVSPIYNNDEADCGTNPKNCTVFIITNARLYKSVDKGSTWTDTSAGVALSVDYANNRALSGVAIANFAISPNYNSDSALFITGTDLSDNTAVAYKSADGGNSWSEVDTPADFNGFVFAPTYDNDEADCVTNAANCVILGYDDHDVYKSHDKGATWDNTAAAVISTPAGDSNIINVVKLSPNYANDNTALIGVQGGGIYGTGDCSPAANSCTGAILNTGITTATPNGEGYINDIEFSPVFDGTEADCGVNPYKCTIFAVSGGETPTYAGQTFKTVNCADPNSDVCSWSKSIASQPWDAIELSPAYDSSTYDASDEIIYIGRNWHLEDYGSWHCTDDGGVLALGAECSKLTDLTTNGTMREAVGGVISPNYATDNTVFIANLGQGLQKSVYNGVSWDVSYLNSGLGKGDLINVQVSPNFVSDSTIFSCSEEGGGSNYDECNGFLYKSTDGGTTWSKTTDDTAYVTAYRVSPNYGTDSTIYAGEAGINGSTCNILKSTNGGSSWSVASTITCNTISGAFDKITAIGISPVNADTVFVGTFGAKVHTSTDGGASFSAGTDVTNEVTDIQVSPSYATDTTALLSTVGNGLASWNGAAWSVVPGGGSYDFVIFAPQYDNDEADCGANPENCTFFFVDTANNRLYITNDKGVSVTNLTPAAGFPDTIRGVAISPNYEYGGTDQQIWVGFDDTAQVYKSFNGGTNWNTMPGSFGSTYASQKRGVNLGDINGDGLDDFANASDIFLNTSVGRDNTSDYTLTDIYAGGDLNGDGYAEVIQKNGANIEIFKGGSTFDTTVDYTLDDIDITSESIGDNGMIVADINGDGYKDLIVGVYTYDGAGTDRGAVAIYFGGSSFNDSLDVTLNGEADSNYFGYVVSAGDVNGDGFDDLIVGAYGHNSSAGKVYIYYGGKGFDDTVDVVITGSAGDNFGIALSAAGDLNGDGIDDIAVGASQPTSGSGSVYVFYGDSSFSSSLTTGDADATLSDSGAQTGSDFGKLVAMADIDNDGYGDVAIGAPDYFGAAENHRGKYYVYLGGDTFNATADYTYDPGSPGSNEGPEGNLTLIDMDNDGYLDVRSVSHNGSDTIHVDGTLIDIIWKLRLSTSETRYKALVVSPDYANDKKVFVGGGRDGLDQSFSYKYGNSVIISKIIDNTVENINVATLTATANTPTNTSITYYLSNDGGANWESVTSGSEHTFTYTGSDLRWKAVLNTTDVAQTPSITNISITYGNTIPGTISLSSPSDGAGGISLNPTFQFSATDPNSDKIYYILEIGFDSSLNKIVYEFDQKEDGIFYLKDDVLGWSQVTSYNSGETAYFTLPSKYQLTPNATYYWRVKAIDESGGAKYSSIYSFSTTASSITDNFDTTNWRDSSNTTAEWNVVGNVVRAPATNSFATGSAALSPAAAANDTTMVLPYDVDYDGDVDILVANYGNINYLYTNDGNGSFTEGTPFPNNATNRNTNVFIAVDLDGDGYADIIEGNNGQNYYYTNDGSGTFGASSQTAGFGSNNTTSLYAIDIDKDGDVDILEGTTAQDKLWTNNGDGTFTASDAFYNGNTTAIVAADIDKDGDFDVLISDADNDAVKIYTNDGTGTFSLSATVNYADNAGSDRLIVDDFDNDGDEDLLISNGASLFLYNNDGAGNFTVDANFSYAYGNVATGDIDLDGDVDIIALYGGDGGNAILRNLGHGNFSEETGVFASGPASYVDETDKASLADIDGDGDLDVIHVYSCAAGGCSTADDQNYIYENNLHNNDADDGWSQLYGGSNFPNQTSGILPLGDVNYDGYEDLAVLYGPGDGTSSYLYLGDGKGGFTATNPFTDSSCANNDVAKSADFNNDQYLDVVVGADSGWDCVYFNDGNGNFNTVTQIYNDADTRRLWVADLDKDDDQDIVIFRNGQNYIYTNDGDGSSFTQTNLGSGTNNTNNGYLADIDNDGDIDILEGNLSSQQNYLYRNRGNGTFVREAQFGKGTTQNIFAIDLDGDGYKDVMVSNSDINSAIYWNKGDGTFRYQSLGVSVTFNIVDVNADGDADLVYAAGVAGTYIYNNNGRGEFTVELLDDIPATYVLAHDVNRDGMAELLVANSSGNSYVYTPNLTHSTSTTYIAQSSEMDSASREITIATLTADDYTPGSSAIQYYLSNNGGSSWEAVNSGEENIFAGSGSDLRWKAELTPGSSPLIYSVTLSYNTASSSFDPGKPANPVECRGVSGLDGSGYSNAEGLTAYWLVDYPVDFENESDRENLEFLTYIAAKFSDAYSWSEYLYDKYEDSSVKYWIEQGAYGNQNVNKDTYYSQESFGLGGVHKLGEVPTLEEAIAGKYNTELSGRRIYVKYKNNGAISAGYAECPSLWTLAAFPAKPTLNLATSRSLSVSVDNYSFAEDADWGESGTEFEIYQGEEINDDTFVATSEKILALNGYTFGGLTPKTTYTIRARGYNGDGAATPWSEALTVETEPPTFSLIKTATIRRLGEGEVRGISAVSVSNFDPRIQQLAYLKYLGDFSAILSFFIVLSLVILTYQFLLWNKAQRVLIKLKYQRRIYPTLAVAISLGIIKMAMIATMTGFGGSPLVVNPAYEGDGVVVEPEDTITYKIDYINDTNDDLENVVIQDELDPALLISGQLVKDGQSVGKLDNFISLSGDKALFNYNLGIVKSGEMGYLSLPLQVSSAGLQQAVDHTIANTAIAVYIQKEEEKEVKSNTLNNPAKAAAIDVFAFIDKNNNKKYDIGEQGLAGVSSLTYYDINKNGILDREIETVTNVYYSRTLTGGHYTVDGRRGGRYFAEIGKTGDITAPAIPSGYTLTTPALVTVDLSSGGTVQAFFGFFKEEEQPPPTITNPANNSQITDNTPTISGNANLANAVVSIYIDNSYTASTTSNAGGFYSHVLRDELALGDHSAQVRVGSLYSNVVDFEIIEIKEEEAAKEEGGEKDIEITVEVGRVNIEEMVARAEGVTMRDIQMGRVGVEQRLVDVKFIVTLRNAIPGVSYEFVVESDPITYQFTPQDSDWVENINIPLPSGEHRAYVRVFDSNINDYRTVSNTVEFTITLPACFDGIDNDNDGDIDYPDDAGCLSIQDQDESGEEMPGFAELYITSVLDIAREIVNSVAQLADDPAVEKATQNYVAPALIAVAAANAYTAISFIYLIPYLQFIFTEPLRLLSRRKRKGWGTVYNSISKEPVDLAIVRLLNAETGVLVQTQITDKQGRYNLIVKEAGNYRIEVKKSEYKYPTEILADKKEDAAFLDLYHGEKIDVGKEGAIITANIPLDPLGETKSNKKVLAIALARQVQNGVSLSGLGLSVITFIIVPKFLMGILVALHLMLYLLFRRLAYPAKPKGWGIVYDKDTKKTLSKAIVRIFDTRFNKLLAVQVTGPDGRYGFLVGSNEYYITSEKPDYSSYKSEPLNLIKEKAVAITLDIPLEKQEEEMPREIIGDVEPEKEVGEYKDKMAEEAGEPFKEKFEGIAKEGPSKEVKIVQPEVKEEPIEKIKTDLEKNSGQGREAGMGGGSTAGESEEKPAGKEPRKEPTEAKKDVDMDTGFY